MPSYRVTSASIAVLDATDPCLPTVCDPAPYASAAAVLAWQTTYSSDYNLIDSACDAVNGNIYSATDIEQATEDAMNGIEDELSGGTIAVDINGSAYRPGSNAHSGSAWIISASSGIRKTYTVSVTENGSSTTVNVVVAVCTELADEPA